MKRIESRFVREQQRYTKEQLNIILGCEKNKPEEFEELVRRLKAYNVLKTTKKDESKKDLTDLSEDDILSASFDSEETEKYYVFTYVGLISIAGRFLKCFPKYFSRDKENNKEKLLEELKQVIKVIKKSNPREQNFQMYYEGGREKSLNLLAMAMFFFEDYYENGLYSNNEKRIEINGSGEIDWNRTINDGFAIIHNNKPYYTELYTLKTFSNEKDYFSRLHACILTSISKELEDSDISTLLDINIVNISEEAINDFGDADYIQYRIERELKGQFNTRKQTLLKAFYAFISENASFKDPNNVSFVGTNSFNLVWESVCQNILTNQLDNNLNKLKLPVKLSEKYKKYKNLLEIIDKPAWEIEGFPKPFKAKTLKPDLASIDSDNSIFLIFDAKYYVINTSSSGAISGNPGIEDVTKQYLYQLAYKEFANEHRLTNVRNCFLMPTEKEEVVSYGSVHMDMLEKLGLQKILVRLVPAKRAFELYLTGKQMDASELDLDLEEAAEETVDEELFYEYSEDSNLIPLYESLAAAGPNYDLGLGDKVCRWIKRPEDHPLSRADFAVTIAGNSMEPEISDGERIYVDASVRKELRNGDIGIFTVNGSEVCKVLYRDREGNVNLLSLNPEEEYSNIYLDGYSQEEFIVRGKVLGKTGYIPEYFKG